MYWPRHLDYLGAPEEMYVDHFDCLFDIALDHYFTTTVCFDLGLPEELYLISAVCSIWYCRRMFYLVSTAIKKKKTSSLLFVFIVFKQTGHIISSTEHENNVAQPTADKCPSSTSHLSTI